MDAILGGLIGSIATILITKLLELIQKRQEHKYSLQKSYFEKKLNAAEAAVSQWYVTAASIGALAKLYEQAPILEDGISSDVFDAMHNQFQMQLNQVQQSSDTIAHSFLLYFDVDNESFWENETLKTYLSKLSTISVVIKSLDVLFDLSEKAKGTEDESVVAQEITKLNQKLKTEVQDFVSIMESARQTVIDLLKQVRSEMKRFEV